MFRQFVLMVIITVSLALGLSHSLLAQEMPPRDAAQQQIIVRVDGASCERR